MAEKKPTPVPTAKKDDAEDVSWALSTAEAMWNRGDHVDAVKWIRRAAEAASEAELDDRALELASAAADLASQVGPIPQTAPPPPVARPSAPPPRQSVQPPPPSRPTSPPPIPNANKAAPKPVAPLTSATPPRAPAPPRMTGPMQPRAAAPSRGGTAPMIPAVRPAAGVPATPAKTPSRGRKSSANLTDEAKRAIPSDITIRGADNEVTQTVQVPEPRRRGRSKPAPEEIAPPAPPPPLPPIVHEPVSTTTDEMDSWPTQSLTGDDDFDDDKERTRIGAPAYQETVLRASERPPPAPVQPELSSTQAFRVVVWRGADGVHVAPYGTTVNAIGVDAMLVALDPGADLATWLSKS